MFTPREKELLRRAVESSIHAIAQSRIQMRRYKDSDEDDFRKLDNRELELETLLKKLAE
jgi:hypothetical protein